MRELGGNEGARGAEGGRQGSAAGHWVPSALFVYSAPPPRPPRPPRPPGANWIDPPKRERKRVASYAESEFYRISLAKREYGPRASGPKLPRMPALQDFQFFDIPRITQLYEKENAHETHKHVLAQVCGWGLWVYVCVCGGGGTPGCVGWWGARAGCWLASSCQGPIKRLRHTHSLAAPSPPPLPLGHVLQKEAALRQQGGSDEAIAAEMQPKEDDPQPLTEEELQGACGALTWRCR